jgi:ubiquinone/menaquinone biosynthesis C-methylase UbiE
VTFEVKDINKTLEKRQIVYYDAEYSKYLEYKLQNWRASYLRRIFSLLEISPDDSFLDVGAGGTGYTNIEAAKRGITSIGIDLSAIGMRKAWQFAKKNLGDKSVYCHFIVASATLLPLRNETVTRIVSIAVLEHIPNDNAAISEMSRVARAKSKVLITVPNTYQRILPFFRYIYKLHDTRVGHLRHYKSEDLVMYFNRNSFALCEAVYHAHIPRLVSFLLSIIFGENNRIIRRIWWALEDLDHSLSKIPSGIQLSLLFKKY